MRARIDRLAAALLLGGVSLVAGCLWVRLIGGVEAVPVLSLEGIIAAAVGLVVGLAAREPRDVGNISAAEYLAELREWNRAAGRQAPGAMTDSE